MNLANRPQWPRRVAPLVAGMLILAITACGRGGTESRGPGGTAATPGLVTGFDGSTIKVGVVTAQTGPVKVIGDPVTNGNRVFFEGLNANGGIAGKYKVEMVVVDSAYDATKAIQQYNAIKDRVVLFGQLLGTPMVSAALPQLKRDNLVAAPVSLDAFWVREQNLLPIGGPYQIQAINAMSWYVSEGGGKGQKICWAGHDDPYGAAGLEGVEIVAKAQGFTLAAKVKFKATDQDFTAPVQQLQAAGCQAVFLGGTPGTAGGVMGKAAATGYAPKWIGQAATYTLAFLKSPLLPYLQANYLLASEGPDYAEAATVGGMKRLITDQQKYAPTQQPDPYFTFGYLEAWSVAQLLEKAVARGDLSRGGIIKAMNSLEKLSFDGLSGDYAYGPPDRRNPPRVSTVFSVDPSVPGGLKTLKRGIETDAAKNYVFAA